MKARRVELAIMAAIGVAAGLAAMLPELLFGLGQTDSFRYNLVWGDQFVTQMRSGIVYPRWLAQSWDGLGSPAFYFYPPLFFWTAGAIGLAGTGVQASISLASALFIAASGITMFLWLRFQTGARQAMAAAIFYMLAPYHLVDIHSRGALAEATVYAALPLVALAMHRISRGSRSAVAAMAAGFALMLLGHLPATLLATLLVLIPYGLWLAFSGSPEGRFRLTALFAAGGTMGLGLAGAFLLPMAALLPLVSSERLFGAFYQPANWFLFLGERSVFWARLDAIHLSSALLALAYLLLAAAALVRAGQFPAARFWACVGIAGFVLVSGAFPQFWELPLIRLAQFPSRIFVAWEFAAATAMALCWGRIGLAARIGTMTFLLAAYLAAWSIVEQRVALASTQGAALSGLALRQYREAPEFLPRGSSIGYDEEDRADPSTVRLPALGGAEAVAAGAAIGPVRPLPDGGLRLTVATAGPTLITVRRHYFPGWIARNLATGDLAEVRPNGPLAAWKVPAGRHDFELRRGPAPFERLGWIVSAISLIILAAGLWLTCYSGLAVTRRNTSSTGS